MAMHLNQHGRDIIGKNKVPKLGIDEAERLVEKLNPDLNINQFSALVSFAVAVGEHRFMRSRVAKASAYGQHFQVIKEILAWGRRGTKTLRQREAALYARFVCIDGGKDAKG